VLDKIRRLFECDNWAIVREFSVLRGVENPEALKMLAHILAAKEIWFVRLNGQDSSRLNTFPELSFSECKTLADELDNGYQRFLSALDEAALESSITYKNTKGEEFTTPIGEVLMHIVLHSSYHRGQIALLLRQNGNIAVNTDFITFTRL
jgi:uncharacterized damage-inducible protein DinB